MWCFPERRTIQHRTAEINTCGDKGALQRIFFQKSEIIMDVGGWVQDSRSRSEFFFLNRPKIALNQY